MLFFNRALAPTSYILASAFAAGVPMGLGYLIFNAEPGACYDGPCALPLLLVTVPPVAAPALLIAFFLNRRFGARVPDGWLPGILMSAIIAQIGISLTGILIAAPNIRRLFFSDILFVPQGLIVGLTVGAVFWATLHASARKRT